MTDKTAESLRIAADYINDNTDPDHAGIRLTPPEWMYAEADRIEAAQKDADQIEAAAKLAYEIISQGTGNLREKYLDVARALEAHFAQPDRSCLRCYTSITPSSSAKVPGWKGRFCIDCFKKLPTTNPTQVCTHDLDAMVERLLEAYRKWAIECGVYEGPNRHDVRQMLEHVLGQPAKQWTDEEYARIGAQLGTELARIITGWSYDDLFHFKGCTDSELGRMLIKLVTGGIE